MFQRAAVCRVLFARAALFVPLLLAVAATATATSSASAQNHPIPYFGREVGVNFVQDFDFPFLTIGIQAEGIASQVGRYRGTGAVVLDVTTGEILSANFVTTDRAGHQLFAELDATPLDPFTLLVEGTIVGGTGRFAGATGEYLFLLRYDQPSDVLPNTYRGEFSGWISR